MKETVNRGCFNSVCFSYDTSVCSFIRFESLFNLQWILVNDQ